MTDFFARNWVLVLVLGGMAFMYFGMHRGRGQSGHGGGCCGGPANGRDQEKEHDMSQESPRTVDPVCGMSVDPATAAAIVEHEGHPYYFCGKGCAKSFSADPGKYANASVS